jgi:hypothetical protein
LTAGAFPFRLEPMSWMRRSVAAALLAPMLVLAVSAFGFVGLRCRMTGMVSFATCCPDVGAQLDGEDDAPPAPSSVGEPGCCDRVVVVNIKPAGTAPVTARQGDPLVPRPTLVQNVTVTYPPSRARAPLAFEPPRLSRPPLPLLKRSLLI